VTAGAFLRWLPHRLWCSIAGHRWIEADQVPSRYGLVDGYECTRCKESSHFLFVWQRTVGEEEGSD
jgi:hypothetical protein